MRKQIRRKTGIAFLLLLLILALSWLNTRQEWIETIYALKIYPPLGNFLRLIFGWIPFSLGDIFYLVVIGFLLLLLIKLTKHLIKGKFGCALYNFLKVIITLEALVIVFYVFWGMNYFRYSTAQRLEINREDYGIKDLVPAASYLIEKANHYRASISPAEVKETTNRQIYQLAAQAYHDLGKSNPAFAIRHPQVKPALFTPLINFMGVAGYFNPFTGEAQLNYAMPTHVMPFVACHEIAHQAGFGPEDAASFAGFLAGTHSDSKLLQYSVYYTAMKDVLHAISRIDRKIYTDLYARISPEIKKDLDTEYYFWAYYRGPVDAISDFFYDHFLKANNQPKGLQTYNEMIGLLIAYYHKQGILR